MSTAGWASGARIALAAGVLAGGWAALMGTARAADQRTNRQRDGARIAAVSAAAGAVSTTLDLAAKEAHGIGAATSRGAAGEDQSLTTAAAGAALLDDGAFLVDRNGAVVATTVAHEDLAHQLRLWPELGEAIAGRPSVSGMYEDPLEHTVDILVAAPGPGGTAVAGRMRVTGGALAAALARVTVPPGAQLVVADSRDEVIAGADPNPPGVKAPSGLRAALEDGRSRPAGLEVGQAEGGAPIMVARAPATAGWVVLLTEPLPRWRSEGGRVAANLAWPAAGTAAVIVLLLLAAELRLLRVGRRADRVASDLLSVASHELRTPLTAIRGFAETLNRGGASLSASRRHEMVDAISRQSTVLEHLIDRLLTASRIGAGAPAGSLAVRPVELRPVLERVAGAHGGAAPLHQITIDVPDGVTVRGEPSALDEVFGQLVENAVKYSPAGGPVTITARRHRRTVEVTVDDEGVGLPADTRHLFDRFTQAEPVNTRTYDEGGMGLGLYIARTLVTQMGGSISARGRQPRGASFAVRLRADRA